ncbi:MAG TPA: DUF4197 domain-containing protein [Ohtaekwangia sp.]
MKKLILALTVLVSSCTSAQISQTMKEVNKAIGTESGDPTTAEVADGLKEALINGISNGSDMASQLDGYFKNPKIKIPFPPDVKKVETKLRQVGMGNEVDKFILTLNRGAEDAAKEAKPIFISAIKQMTIQDAWAILKGSDNAATEYLKKVTSAQLYDKFKPVIKSSLDKVNATKNYGTLVTAYNKIPLVEKVNPDLDDYATKKAMDGLFLLIADEEKKIRQDPMARTTDLLKKVFGYKK